MKINIGHSLYSRAQPTRIVRVCVRIVLEVNIGIIVKNAQKLRLIELN